MRTKRACCWMTMAAVGLLLSACGANEPVTAEDIAESLELENGGFDMNDEMPAFGHVDLDALPVDVTALGDIPEESGVDLFTGKTQTKTPAKAAPCPRGFLKGTWKPFVQGKPYGRYWGKWVTQNGKVDGYLKGIYGVNKLGHGVFFGKYIDPQGKARGLLKGYHGKGFFRGVWHGVHGGKGVLRGVYGKGVFKGAWRAFCPTCKLTCKPGFFQPKGACICVPKLFVPCKKGKCPKGMFCDPCPKPLACLKPGVKCPAVCAPPTCKKLPMPPKPAKPGNGKPSAGNSQDSAGNLK